MSVLSTELDSSSRIGAEGNGTGRIAVLTGSDRLDHAAIWPAGFCATIA
jgi:hypothetical protein